jgi:hypothetical protein
MKLRCNFHSQREKTPTHPYSLGVRRCGHVEMVTWARGFEITCEYSGLSEQIVEYRDSCIGYFFFLWRHSPNLGIGLTAWNSPFHFGLLDLRYSLGLLVRVISSSQGRDLYTKHRKTHTHTHHTNTKHSCPEWDSNRRFLLPSDRRQYMP